MVKSKSSMVIITISITKETKTFLDSLVNIDEIAPSRSELVRMCITDAMPKLMKMHKKRQKIVSELHTSENFLTPNDVIFVKDRRNGSGYSKFKIVGEA